MWLWSGGDSLGCGVQPLTLLWFTTIPLALVEVLVENMAEVEVGELPPVEEGVMRLSYWDQRRPGGAGVGSNPGEESNVRSVQSGEITSLP